MEAIPATSNASIPIAQYLRMSTENQRYSIANQRAAIGEFISANNMVVVKTFVDHGKSGLTLAGRQGLQRLLRDVLSRGRKFEAIVVYDVSRWGRFQDVDESAFYEHLCRRAGVRVLYCAESFDCIPGPMGTVIKSIKRAMAAEYSKELSTKVYATKALLAKQGYYVGGPAVFGLKRVQVSADGTRRQDLLPGERKSRTLDHVELAPGDPFDCGLVRLIFDMYVQRNLSETEIANQLNWSCYPSRIGLTPWRPDAIRSVLRDEHYVGTMVYGAHTQRLKSSRRYVARSDRIRVYCQFPAIVEKGIFDSAQLRVGERQLRKRWSNAQLLDLIREEHARSGRFSITELQRHGGPGAQAFIRQFGSVADACQAASIDPSKRAITCGARRKQRHALKLQTLGWLADFYRSRGLTFYCDPSTRRACIEHALTLSIRVAHPQDTHRTIGWSLRQDKKLKADLGIFLRVTDAGKVLDYFVIPGDETRRGYINSTGAAAHPWLSRCRCEFPADVIRRLEANRSSGMVYVPRMLQNSEARRKRRIVLDGRYRTPLITF